MITDIADLAFPSAWWMHAADCANHDPEIWFPTDKHLGVLAKLICAGCPVRTECTEYALRDPELHGIWGGLTKQQRQALRKHTHTNDRREAHR